MVEVWRAFVSNLSAVIGKPVEYVHFADTAGQLEAIREGQLHVAGLNTGLVPVAVNSCGFIPVSTFGNGEGEYGYHMKLIVPPASAIQSVADIREHKVTFTRRSSNSGFKAAIVMLINEQGLAPETDFDWGFSNSHEGSIRGVADGTYEVAPVASDILERMVDRGELEADAVRGIYESERFPPAALGYAYNLKSALRESIRKALLEFSWSGTELAAEFGGAGTTQFVLVNFKDDWEPVRRVDNAVGYRQTLN